MFQRKIVVPHTVIRGIDDRIHKKFCGTFLGLQYQITHIISTTFVSRWCRLLLWNESCTEQIHCRKCDALSDSLKCRKLHIYSVYIHARNDLCVLFCSHPFVCRSTACIANKWYHMSLHWTWRTHRHTHTYAHPDRRHTICVARHDTSNTLMLLLHATATDF